MYKISILIIMTIVFSSCTSKQSNPEKWTETETDKWFEKGEWLGGWDVQPDKSIDRRALALNYFKNQERWDKAFLFLKTADLKALPLGKQELDGQRLFVSIDEYTTKDKSETRYESHKKYIDIQYIIDGEELIGLTTPDNVNVTEPYNEEKDIAFYAFEGGDDIKVTPGNFVVFFPDDVHRPVMKANANSKVRKIVVKILME
jgi:YhcH/YjgK/YiaL family protein